MRKSTQTVKTAIYLVPHSIPFSEEIRTVLERAYGEAWEQELYWESEEKPYLRTFLKTTPLGLAILELAEKILADRGVTE